LLLKEKSSTDHELQSLFNTDQSCTQTTTYIRTLTQILSFQSLRNKSENPATAFLPRAADSPTTHTSIHKQKNKKPQTKPKLTTATQLTTSCDCRTALSTQTALRITAKEKKIDFIKTKTKK
jgi:hypothetical protein